MSELVAYSDAAWQYSLAFLAFDLDMEGLRIAAASQDPLVSFVSAKYAELRRQGLCRRRQTAENSRRWADGIVRASNSSEARDGRSALLRVLPVEDKTVLYLDSAMLTHVLSLTQVVHDTSFGCIYNALTSGYYYQPDGSLDSLFTWLDNEFGRHRDYFREICFFELGHRFTVLRFANQTQLRVSMLKIRQIAEGRDDSPRIAVAAAWAFECLKNVIERYRHEQTVTLPDLARPLLEHET